MLSVTSNRSPINNMQLIPCLSPHVWRVVSRSPLNFVKKEIEPDFVVLELMSSSQVNEPII